jgi:hypothetical protein
MKNSLRVFFLMLIFVAVSFFIAAYLLSDVWNRSHVVELTAEIQQSLTPTEIISLIDLQIDHAKQRLHDLDPGPPPPWFYPSYYYDWLPKAKLYAEAQETLQLLRKQKMELISQGKTQFKQMRSFWNFGIAPILHTLLSITLILTALRCALRYALWRGLFPWRSIEK